LSNRFDGHAPVYNQLLDAAIGASGENGHFFADLKASLLAREIGPSASVSILDFGCGIGNSTRALERHFAKASVLGCDPSTESIRHARELASRGGRATYVHLTDPDLPWPTATFDVVFTSNVLHHIDRPTHAVVSAEFRRVVKPGGSVFVFEHNPYNPLTRRVVAACPFDRDAVLLPPRYLKGVLQHAGLRPEAPQFYFFFPNALARLRLLERYLRRVPFGAQYFVRARRSSER
jgi:SAM-dependent methyltransferase